MKYTKAQIKEFCMFADDMGWFEFGESKMDEQQMDAINSSLVFALWRIGNALRDLKRTIIKTTGL